MNSVARMQAAMRLQEPDRVPVMCQLATGHYFLNASPSPIDIWYTSEGFAEALVEMATRYRFDGILINLPGRDPNYEKHIDRLVDEPDNKRYVVHWKNGCFTTVAYDDNPHYFQPDGSRYFPTLQEVDPDTLFYVEPWSLTDITYPFTWSFDPEPRPLNDYFPDYHLDSLRAVKAKANGRFSIHCELFSPFAQLLELLNYEVALMALLDDPEKCHACLDRLTEGAIALAGNYAAEGADAILISSAFAGGGMISRAHYETFVLPYEARLIKTVQAAHAGIPFYTHTCGAIGDRLDLMLETGTNGIDTLDPPPLGTVDLEDAVDELKGQAFIKGNLDPVCTLLQGTMADVEAAVRHRLKVAAPGGGYILSSACSVAPAVKPEYLERLAELAETEGRYA